VNVDNVREELDFNQKNVLEFRAKILEILQDRSSDINERIEKLLSECKAKITERDFNRILRAFLSFECVDKHWKKRLKNIRKSFDVTTEKNLSLYCEQFLVNSIYRHLSDAEDTMWVRARTIACIVSWWVIEGIIMKEQGEKQAIFDVVLDVIRAYSVEIEYSQKNLNKLFDLCYSCIKI
jgi:uncharacterized protein YpuA (DUF1002 family)